MYTFAVNVIYIIMTLIIVKLFSAKQYVWCCVKFVKSIHKNTTEKQLFVSLDRNVYNDDFVKQLHTNLCLSCA